MSNVLKSADFRDTNPSRVVIWSLVAILTFKIQDGCRSWSPIWQYSILFFLAYLHIISVSNAMLGHLGTREVLHQSYYKLLVKVPMHAFVGIFRWMKESIKIRNNWPKIASMDTCHLNLCIICQVNTNETVTDPASSIKLRCNPQSD